MTFNDNDKIKALIKNENLFIISSHMGPDGDNIGSSCGFTQYLRAKGKEAYYVMDEELPANLSFIHESCGYLSSEEAKAKLQDRAYVVIVLDCGDEFRIQCDKTLYQKAITRINIDHHESNKGFADCNLVKKKSSSTCQVVWELIEDFDGGDISPEVATCLYTGLVTDSGNFMYASANDSTLRVASILLSKGADKELIMEKLYRNKPKGMIRLLAMVLATLEIKDNIASMYMTKAMLDETCVEYNETEELVNYAIEIEGIDIGYLIKEKEENVMKVSLRSKSNIYNVSKIAEKIGGGGHIMAAGCTIKDSLDVAKSIISNEVKEFVQNV